MRVVLFVLLALCCLAVIDAHKGKGKGKGKGKSKSSKSTKSSKSSKSASCSDDVEPPTAGPPTAGPPTAGPPTAGPPTAGPPTAGPPTAGPPTAGPPTAGPPTAAPTTAAPTTAAPTTSGCSPAECVDDCSNKADGDYQSCNGCTVYATCVGGGTLYDNRPCIGGLVWDDSVKRCERKSTTCCATAAPSTTAPITVVTTTGGCATYVCVDDCSNKADGDYQSCNGCTVYATCAGGGTLYDNRLCPGGLFWDDSAKRCEYKSTTCCNTASPSTTAPITVVTTTGGCSPAECVNDCSNKTIGDYQSCNGCTVYATCAGGGTLYDNRPCPVGLFWDDNVKRCERESTTCCSTAAPA